jgi:hypothetical protein
MRSYWYVSQDKLLALGAFDRGWLSRVRPNAKLGFGAASIGIEVDSSSGRTLTRAAARAERQLRAERLISGIAGFADGAPPTQYFESYGPASRAVIGDVAWVAGTDGETAVLLVGSASNAVGAARITYERSRDPGASADPIGAARYLLEHPPLSDVFSPSADPIGAALHLLEHPPQEADNPVHTDAAQMPDGNVESKGRVATLAYAWEALMRRSLELLGDDISALPRAHSVSLYVARHRFNGFQGSWQAGLKSLVLGTPLYVEQSQ